MTMLNEQVTSKQSRGIKVTVLVIVLFMTVSRLKIAGRVNNLSGEA